MYLNTMIIKYNAKEGQIMKLNTIKLINFRNYPKVELNFNNHLNIIYGNNGEGKTNLVEAIYVLSITKSFRSNDDKMLIKDGELSTKIEGEIENDTKNNYQVIISKDGKKVKINNNIISKLSDYITKINVILLLPDEQTIFTSSPQSRRKLINIEISKLEKEYIVYLNNYNKILKQRNFYLRDLYINGNASKDYLDILTQKLVEWGFKIFNLREKFINSINEIISKKYQSICHDGEIFINYRSDYKNKSKEEIIKIYDKNYKRELAMGKTLYGIHHDDIIFLLDNKDISEWGSNGQKKNAIFAFKLAEIDLIMKEKNTLPLLILDDLFSALDNEKVKNIINLLNDNIQTFITTTELDRLDEKLLATSSIYKVERNEIREEK